MSADTVNGVLDLVRPDLRDFAGYRSARSDRTEGRIWLNANESAWDSPAAAGAGLRRYPEPQPQALREALAGMYGVAPSQVLVGRGSDEGIDLLIRALCRPGADAVVITSPTFGMYAVCARLHGARVVDVPLLDTADGFECDFEAVAAASERAAARIVFLCSPGNPSGTLLPRDAIRRLASRLRGRAVVVVDEAYIEYAQAASLASLLDEFDNVAVLRTLSKAHALAAARIGTVIAADALIGVLQRCQAPYPLPLPCVEAALAAVSRAARDVTVGRVQATVDERQRLYAALRSLPGVRRAYPSRANFLLVRFDDAGGVCRRLLDAGVVVRDMRAQDALGDALRISIGTPEQSAQVLEVLRRGSGAGARVAVA
ncbi:histidinol-phosphate transaminase [Marilutibacter chinensis]|uniref:Histidinol-phosphate aminotransferase n=1 Tax=Marilutibacter chinensis TaxID=2912247 RepID=A0ABS9HR79_9GAMM|nr:histidinol-phosphate transaminase [Lysobacter chinensis]MCF7220803.1 histidinol-phosphate transaminase [Lysobacter chinensis]